MGYFNGMFFVAVFAVAMYWVFGEITKDRTEEEEDE